MTVHELIVMLLPLPMGTQVYIGKGMGPLGNIETGDPYVILNPVVPDGV
jgi:hypothetical protein